MIVKESRHARRVEYLRLPHPATAGYDRCVIPSKTIVTTNRRSILRPLLGETWIPPIIRPVLEGEMGIACVDRIDGPTVCSLSLGGFVMYGGDPEAPAATYFVETTARPCYVLPTTPGWTQLVKRHTENNARSRARYAFSAASLDLAGLSMLSRRLPRGFRVARFDEQTVMQAAARRWSASLVGNFPSAEVFLDLGIGYGVFHNGKIVSGASSFAVVRRTVEVEVDTHPHYRRRGLASVASACLIEHCLEHRLTPHWDAANAASRALAEKLGFTLERRYEVIEI